MRFPGFRYDGKTKTARFEFTVPGTSGKRRRRKTVRGCTRDEALEARKKWKEAIKAESETIRPSPETFAGYVEKYWSAIAARVSPSTARNEGYQLKKWLIPRFASHLLDTINTAELRDLVTALKAAKLSPWSVNGITGLLLRILRDAVERDLLATLPIRGRMKKERTEILHLEMAPEEQERFLEAFGNLEQFRRWIAREQMPSSFRISDYFDGPRRFGGSLRDDSAAARWYFARFSAAGPVFTLALETGLRRGDLLRLTWKHVDLEGGWIRIVTAKRKEPATIAVSARCKFALETLRQRPRRVDQLVCVAPEGDPYSVTTIRRYFATAKEIAGITRRLRFHDLRHTFASDLVSAGVPEAWIRDSMGQRDDRSLRRYAKPREESLRAVAEALDKKGRR